jgi:hypothetical protein
MVLIVAGFTTLDLDVPIQSMSIKNIPCNASALEVDLVVPLQKLQHTIHLEEILNLALLLSEPTLGLLPREDTIHRSLLSSSPSPLVLIAIFLGSPSPLNTPRDDKSIRETPYSLPNSLFYFVNFEKEVPSCKAGICILLTPSHTTTSGQS